MFIKPVIIGTLTPGDDGEFTDTMVADFSGMFHGQDAEYWQRGSSSGQPLDGLPLHVITAGGRTYARG